MSHNQSCYEINLVPVDALRVNLNNPRSITDEKFNQLVKSVKEAPWMLQLRPIVVDKDNVILGGNQRFNACVKAGFKSVWVICADDITEEQARRFVLRDNIEFGKWDLEIIKKQYTSDELWQYGLEIALLEQKQMLDQTVETPVLMSDDDAVEPKISEQEIQNHSKEFNDNTIKQIVFQLPNDIYEEVVNDLEAISMELDCDDNSEVFLRLLNFYEINSGMNVNES